MNQKIHSIDDALTTLELTNEQWNKEWFEITEKTIFNEGLFSRLCDNIRYINTDNIDKLLYIFNLFSLQVLWPEEKEIVKFHCDASILPNKNSLSITSSLYRFYSGVTHFLEKFYLHDRYLAIFFVCRNYIYNKGTDLLFSEESIIYRNYLLYYNWLLVKLYSSQNSDKWIEGLCYLPIRTLKKEGLFQILYSNTSNTKISTLMPAIVNNFMLYPTNNSELRCIVLSKDVKTIFENINDDDRAVSLSVSIHLLTNYYHVKKQFTTLDFEAVYSLFHTTLTYLYRDDLLLNICTCFMDHVENEYPDNLYTIYNTYVNTIENEPNKYLEIGRQLELKSKEREDREAQEQLDKEQLIERIKSLF